MKKYILFFIGGMLFMLVVGVGAATLLTASDVAYTHDGTIYQTVKDALDDLTNNSVQGKLNIVSALNEKGFGIGTNPSYQNILSKINDYPLIIKNDSNGNENVYIKDSNGNEVLFNKEPTVSTPVYYNGGNDGRYQNYTYSGTFAAGTHTIITQGWYTYGGRTSTIQSATISGVTATALNTGIYEFTLSSPTTVSFYVPGYSNCFIVYDLCY